MTELRQVCTLKLDGRLFGLEVLRIQEILRGARLTPVPLAPAGLVGLINLRGQVVTAFELRALLGLPPRPADAPAQSIIVRSPDGPLSFQVDQVGEVLPVDAAQMEPPPETLRGAVRDLLAGACKLQDQILLVLDLDHLLASIVPGALPGAE